MVPRGRGLVSKSLEPSLPRCAGPLEAPCPSLVWLRAFTSSSRATDYYWKCAGNILDIYWMYIHPGSEKVWKFGSNMNQKSILNDIFNLFRALGSVRNGFVFKFPRKSWYREVEGSFLRLFHDHLCFHEFGLFLYRGVRILMIFKRVFDLI